MQKDLSFIVNHKNMNLTSTKELLKKSKVQLGFVIKLTLKFSKFSLPYSVLVISAMALSSVKLSVKVAEHLMRRYA